MEFPLFLPASATGYFLCVCVGACARVRVCKKFETGFFFISEILTFSMDISKNKIKLRLIKVLKIGKVLKSLSCYSYIAVSCRLKHNLAESLLV